MPIGDDWGNKTLPCPLCKGIVTYWFYAPDCRGNDASNGIQCKQCKRNFTSQEWEAVEIHDKLMKEKKNVAKKKSNRTAK